MGTESGATARVDRLRLLYVEQFRESFDVGEFLADDFYAFQVLERAFQVGARNRGLHNLAILMHAERKALMETGQRQALDALRNSTQPGTDAPESAGPVAAAPASQPIAWGQAPVTQFARPKPAGSGAARKDRRAGKVPLSTQEITLLSALRRLFHKYYGQSFDVEEFARNDLFAKVVLAEAMSSGHADLQALARPFLDQSGKPRLHRRMGTVDLEIGGRS